MDNNYDFGGWATKANLRCSDGRTIMPDAFKDCDGQTVPLVWNHNHEDPSEVLGHALLKNQNGSIYAYGSFNDTESGVIAKALVQHKDIRGLSIYANQLKQNGSNVMHGVIREVSLVHAGANPGAYIDVVMAHSADSDGDEAIIYTGEEISLEHNDQTDALTHADAPKKGETVGDVLDTLTDKQKIAVYAMLDEAMKHSGENTESNTTHKEDDEMHHNCFEGENTTDTAVISHADQTAILTTARQSNCGSFQAALAAYAEENSDTLAHGFESIESLFPEAEFLHPGAPEAIPENDAWVTKWMNKTRKSPFSRVRTRQADISKLRAKGYVKGNKKLKMENIALVERTTDPQTVYVTDELNRDDIVDITDFDVVAYQHNLMRNALDTELATASLFGDGREPGNEKIKEDHIRPVWTDDELYTIHKTIDTNAMKAKLQGTNTGANFGEEYIYAETVIAAFRHAMEDYKGSGNLDCYCSAHTLNTMLLARDMNGRRIYDTVSDLAKALHVNSIVECDAFQGRKRTSNAEADRGTEYQLEALFVNGADYNFGATKGGKVSQFSDFDIQYNKNLYLIETRLSGALTRVKSAIALETKIPSPEAP